MLVEERCDAYLLDGIGRLRDSLLCGLQEQTEPDMLDGIFHVLDGKLPIHNGIDIDASIKSFAEHSRISNAQVDWINKLP